MTSRRRCAPTRHPICRRDVLLGLTQIGQARPDHAGVFARSFVVEFIVRRSEPAFFAPEIPQKLCAVFFPELDLRRPRAAKLLFQRIKARRRGGGIAIDSARESDSVRAGSLARFYRHRAARRHRPPLRRVRNCRTQRRPESPE